MHAKLFLYASVLAASGAEAAGEGLHPKGLSKSAALDHALRYNQRIPLMGTCTSDNRCIITVETAVEYDSSRRHGWGIRTSCDVHNCGYNPCSEDPAYKYCVLVETGTSAEAHCGLGSDGRYPEWIRNLSFIEALPTEYEGTRNWTLAFVDRQLECPGWSEVSRDNTYMVSLERRYFPPNSRAHLPGRGVSKRHAHLPRLQCQYESPYCSATVNGFESYAVKCDWLHISDDDVRRELDQKKQHRTGKATRR
ncbi:hypothetical protein O9K51_06217 [Purpureocillium lavendulum]|uniref:Uncharacterized protein n=1 Tax=Purpureocillium lavendulum TaxID=1247861 RepID=A0AB34FMN2_9HYPO|nr:hypothetical protein O9K51_06217 [Purpureocillium lavendulum]